MTRRRSTASNRKTIASAPEGTGAKSQVKAKRFQCLPDT